MWVMEIDGRLGPLRDTPEFNELMTKIQDDINHARAEIHSLAVAAL
jgi:hypothetical protein